jgi:hypothetical protein
LFVFFIYMSSYLKCKQLKHSDRPLDADAIASRLNFIIF